MRRKQREAQPPKPKLFSLQDFFYDERKALCICPAGNKLYSSGKDMRFNGYRVAHFKAPVTACRSCPLRAQGLRHQMAKPPVCVACGRDFSTRLGATGKGGEQVTFADFVDLPESLHSPGREWFCAAHVDAARALSRGSVHDGVAAIRRQASLASGPPNYSGRTPPTLWVMSVGPTRFAVASVLREVTGCSPASAIHRLAAVPFPIETSAAGGDIDSSVRTLLEWQLKLQRAGAVLEIRYNDGLDEQ